MFPKYMFEGALVIGGFGLAGVLFTTQDSVEAVGSLALFLAAGTRVMPSLLRFQGATLGLRGAAGAAGPTFALADELDYPLESPSDPPAALAIKERIRQGNPDFVPSIELSHVFVTYPGAVTPALADVSLSIAAGQSTALVGRSGGGKSTLADVMLGILDPDQGFATVGGIAPATVLAFAFGDDDTFKQFGYLGTKRYLRLTITPTANDAGNLDVSAFVILAGGIKQP
jgi:ATP-binding cassette subfamily C protein